MLTGIKFSQTSEQCLVNHKLWNLPSGGVSTMRVRYQQGFPASFLVMTPYAALVVTSSAQVVNPLKEVAQQEQGLHYDHLQDFQVPPCPLLSAPSSCSLLCFQGFSSSREREDEGSTSLHSQPQPPPPSGRHIKTGDMSCYPRLPYLPPAVLRHFGTGHFADDPLLTPQHFDTLTF